MKSLTGGIIHPSHSARQLAATVIKQAEGLTIDGGSGDTAGVAPANGPNFTIGRMSQFGLDRERKAVAASASPLRNQNLRLSIKPGTVELREMDHFGFFCNRCNYLR